nr:hypothetical protein [Nitrosomonas nitrosa]
MLQPPCRFHSPEREGFATERWNAQRYAGRSRTGGRPRSGPSDDWGRLLKEGGEFRGVRFRRAGSPVKHYVLGLEVCRLRKARDRHGNGEHSGRRRANRLALHGHALVRTFTVHAHPGNRVRGRRHRHRHIALHRRHGGTVHAL